DSTVGWLVEGVEADSKIEVNVSPLVAVVVDVAHGGHSQPFAPNTIARTRPARPIPLHSRTGPSRPLCCHALDLWYPPGRRRVGSASSRLPEAVSVGFEKVLD